MTETHFLVAPSQVQSDYLSESAVLQWYLVTPAIIDMG